MRLVYTLTYVTSYQRSDGTRALRPFEARHLRTKVFESRADALTFRSAMAMPNGNVTVQAVIR